MPGFFWRASGRGGQALVAVIFHTCRLDGYLADMRLDRFLSHATGLTRSQAERAIRAGEVRVAETVVTNPGAHVDAHSAIEFAGSLIEERKPRSLMLHKPAGYVCATEDRDHRAVLDLLDQIRCSDVKRALAVVKTAIMARQQFDQMASKHDPELLHPFLCAHPSCLKAAGSTVMKPPRNLFL